MSKGSYTSLKAQIDKLEGRWQREFAGKPRHTRELGLLDKMIEKAAAVVRKARPLKGEAADELKRVAAARLALYKSERAAIAEAQFDKPEIAEVHRIGRDVDACYATWRRHFAGQERATRDQRLLDRIIARLQAALARLSEIRQDQPDLVKEEGLTAIEGQIEVFKDEKREIAKAWGALEGRDRLTAASVFARQAAARYKVHFSGQPRIACDPLLLETIIARSDDALAAFAAADPELAAELASERETIEAQRAAHAAELPLIHKAHAEASPRDIANALATASNLVFRAYQMHYAGQARHTRDLSLLSALCDRLTDISAQMSALNARSDDPINRKNEPLVEERLRLYESEWIAIAKARTEAASGGAKAAPPNPDIRIGK